MSTSLSMTRQFAAPAEALWNAWTKPEEICRWMGPEGITHCDALEFDVREGGAFRLRMHAGSGEQHVVFGTYRRIRRPELLQFSWGWEGDDTAPSLVTIEIAAVGDGASMTLTHTDFVNAAARDMHIEGWQGSIDKLDAFLAA